MYEEKIEGYFQNIRKELLGLIPEKNKKGRMLEIGADEGSTLVYAKKNGYCERIYGVELCEIDNSFQKSKEFEKFIIGNGRIRNTFKIFLQKNRIDLFEKNNLVVKKL